MDIKVLKTLFSLLILVIYLSAVLGGHSDKVLLSDVKALTLHQGQMTNARRSPAVPQLKCVGGSGQYRFTPKVVQCINRGSDGFDVQWECKADMDNAYRFGNVEVTCEGYDYPSDPYILKGSCGLEYTIELTDEGAHRERQKGNNHYTGSYGVHKESTGGIGGFFTFVAVLIAIYIIYKVCIAVPNAQNGGGPGTTQPPPYGFRPEYMPQGPPPSYESCQGDGFTDTRYQSSFPTGATGSQGGGFWTGAATGGILGYFMGQRNHNRGYGPGYHTHTRSDWFGNSYTGNRDSGSFFSSSSSSGSGGSSGTRTASGFGGTSRR